MNYLIFVVAVVVATAVLLGLLWWYSTRPLYPEADAYTKKYCSDEQVLARASEEAWQQARESQDRTMGPTLEHTVIQLFDSLEQRVKALERQIEMDGRVERHEAALYNVAIRLEKLEAATPDSTLGPQISEGMPTSLRDVNHATATTLEHTTSALPTADSCKSPEWPGKRSFPEGTDGHGNR